MSAPAIHANFFALRPTADAYRAGSGTTSAAENRRWPVDSLRSNRGSVLVIVMWICFGLVALTLYFAQSMSSELRAADNRVVGTSAHQALLGGVRYVNYVLTNYGMHGTVPLSTDYKAEALPVGDASFWLIGRDPGQLSTTSPKDPYYGIVDEASKLNLNYASLAMLQSLPGMTPDLAAAIVAWRTTNSNGSSGSASDNTYAQLDPPRHNKSGKFETTDELRLVYGATLDLLLGEDTNRNGVLDANEDDGDKTPPRDNQNGVLDPGFLEYVTVYSVQPNTRSGGGNRFNVTNPQNTQFRTYLSGKLGPTAAERYLRNVGLGPISSVAEFYAVSQMSADEFLAIHNDITHSTGTTVSGLINVNTASQTVLACIPGIGPDLAASLVAYRSANPNNLTSLAWIVPILGRANVRIAGRYLTDESYQFTADIAAVNRSGRGYCREKIVFDTTKSAPRIIFRQDLTSYGWALGSTVRESLKTAKQSWQ